MGMAGRVRSGAQGYCYRGHVGPGKGGQHRQLGLYDDGFTYSIIHADLACRVNSPPDIIVKQEPKKQMAFPQPGAPPTENGESRTARRPVMETWTMMLADP